MPQQKYIKPHKIALKSRPEGGETLSYLLWGDPVQVKDSNPPNAEWVEVMARFWDSGFVKRADLMDDPILEIYIIDVGQGDGVLFKTPDNKWHLLDAGTTNSRQMTRKGAANFVRFKFIQDLRREKIQLENMILSHPDLDHYGGMIDLLKGDLHGHDPFETEVVNFYHNGLGRFKESPKLGTEVRDGAIADFPIRSYNLNKKPTFITQLLNDKADFQANLSKFTDEYNILANLLIEKVNRTARLSAQSRFLPGYAQDNQQIQIRVLGPIVETYNGNKQGLRKFSSDSKTVNGHSIVLRIDYGQVKILLTGDLNEDSQKLLLNYLPKEDFAVDIAKGCHHGSEDVLFDFLKHMKPKATIISSGDNESYSHPQPQILGASGYYGSEYKGSDGKQYPPLVYSTELARSTELKFPLSVKTRSQPGADDYIAHKALNTLIQAQGEDRYRTLMHVPINTDLIYGLVSVRTDGRTVLIATSEEQGRDFDTKVLRFD